MANEVTFTAEDIYRSESNFEPIISEKYSRGKNLIYDCFDKHYVCVSDVNYDDCRSLRDLAIEKRKVILPCAPLKVYDSQISCFSSYYTLIHQKTYKGFCIRQQELD